MGFQTTTKQYNKLAGILREETVQRTHAQSVDAGRKQLRHEHLVADVTNAERQRGNGLMATVFMTKLRKLNPDLIMKPHPRQHEPLHKGIAGIYLTLPDGSHYFITPCEGEFMPEWTTLRTVEVLRPDPKLGTAWAKTFIPGRVVSKGYREVLIRLIKGGYVSLDAVEREFGVPVDRISWATLTGKRSSERPLV